MIVSSSIFNNVLDDIVPEIVLKLYLIRNFFFFSKKNVESWNCF